VSLDVDGMGDCQFEMMLEWMETEPSWGGEDPRFPLRAWHADVVAGLTRVGYVEWVTQQRCR
jgi:hypothetical protein